MRLLAPQRQVRARQRECPAAGRCPAIRIPATLLSAWRRVTYPYASLAPEHSFAPLVAADPQRWNALLYCTALRAEGA
ncbi:hypothetical protein PsYK624_061330 [Phanerochaete sordida]|uniref:Uncharacterized protein n=1 Tax=Phanerochaete sordida TaxID=48140 RepID=A0A9P3LDK0_9APHY|nr:hypothetical protein PsYK624_061330 [Phanerochaete sordida]